MSDVDISLFVLGIILCATFVVAIILMIVNALKEKKAFNDLKIGDIYVYKRDIKNPFCSRRRYVRITSKSDANGVRWVEYKNLFGSMTEDVKWTLFYDWFAKEYRTAEEIENSINEYKNK